MFSLTDWLFRELAILTFGLVHLWWFGTVSGQTFQTQMAGEGGWWREGPPVEQTSKMRS